MLFPLFTCRSTYTFLEGVHSIKDLINFAKEKGIGTLCLADKNGLYGAVEFYVRCQEANILPLIGTELVQGERHVTIIARNLTGYEELSEWVTRYHLRNLRIQDELSPESPNLVYVCGDPFLLQRWLLRKGSHGNMFLSLTLSDPKSFRSVLNLISRRSDLAKASAVPVVELNLLSPSDRSLYEVLTAIRHGCTVDTLSNEERPIREEKKNSRSFYADPESIPYEPLVSGTHMAELCRLEFDLARYHLPKYHPDPT